MILILTWMKSRFGLKPNEYDSKDIAKLSKLLNMEENQVLNGFNGIYPRVLEFQNKQIINDYEIKCNGFDCSSINMSRSMYE